jgi:hypothetical protein
MYVAHLIIVEDSSQTICHVLITVTLNVANMSIIVPELSVTINSHGNHQTCCLYVTINSHGNHETCCSAPYILYYISI